ncbi:hypothetical protein CRM22_001783 [Opisthorchis felineus]|uniref:Uncharacterized protein n=1 Tax=Opisthorchis felineus TaxID=147828 RepID=A0A4S2M8Z7_OPIFE|nr:hypothetical protein CRM22_001783 [Opisthorchis felineus]
MSAKSSAKPHNRIHPGSRLFVIVTDAITQQTQVGMATSSDAHQDKKQSLLVLQYSKSTNIRCRIIPPIVRSTIQSDLRLLFGPYGSEASVLNTDVMLSMMMIRANFFLI